MANSVFGGSTISASSLPVRPYDRETTPEHTGAPVTRPTSPQQSSRTPVGKRRVSHTSRATNLLNNANRALYNLWLHKVLTEVNKLQQGDNDYDRSIIKTVSIQLDNGLTITELSELTARSDSTDRPGFDDLISRIEEEFTTKNATEAGLLDNAKNALADYRRQLRKGMSANEANTAISGLITQEFHFPSSLPDEESAHDSSSQTSHAHVSQPSDTETQPARSHRTTSSTHYADDTGNPETGKRPQRAQSLPEGGHRTTPSVHHSGDTGHPETSESPPRAQSWPEGLGLDRACANARTQEWIDNLTVNFDTPAQSVTQDEPVSIQTDEQSQLPRSSTSHHTDSYRARHNSDVQTDQRNTPDTPVAGSTLRRTRSADDVTLYPRSHTQSGTSRQQPNRERESYLPGFRHSLERTSTHTPSTLSQIGSRYRLDGTLDDQSASVINLPFSMDTVDGVENRDSEDASPGDNLMAGGLPFFDDETTADDASSIQPDSPEAIPSANQVNDSDQPIIIPVDSSSNSGESSSETSGARYPFTSTTSTTEEQSSHGTSDRTTPSGSIDSISDSFRDSGRHQRLQHVDITGSLGRNCGLLDRFSCGSSSADDNPEEDSHYGTSDTIMPSALVDSISSSFRDSDRSRRIQHVDITGSLDLNCGLIDGYSCGNSSDEDNSEEDDTSRTESTSLVWDHEPPPTSKESLIFSQEEEQKPSDNSANGICDQQQPTFSLRKFCSHMESKDRLSHEAKQLNKGIISAEEEQLDKRIHRSLESIEAMAKRRPVSTPSTVKMVDNSGYETPNKHEATSRSQP